MEFILIVLPMSSVRLPSNISFPNYELDLLFDWRLQATISDFQGGSAGTVTTSGTGPYRANGGDVFVIYVDGPQSIPLPVSSFLF